MWLRPNRAPEDAGHERQKSPHTRRRATGFLNLGTAARRPLLFGFFFSYALACGSDGARPRAFGIPDTGAALSLIQTGPDRFCRRNRSNVTPGQHSFSGKPHSRSPRLNCDERFVTAFYHLRLEHAREARQVRPSAAGAL